MPTQTGPESQGRGWKGFGHEISSRARWVIVEQTFHCLMKAFSTVKRLIQRWNSCSHRRRHHGRAGVCSKRSEAAPASGLGLFESWWKSVEKLEIEGAAADFPWAEMETEPASDPLEKEILLEGLRNSRLHGEQLSGTILHSGP